MDGCMDGQAGVCRKVGTGRGQNVRMKIKR